jgi:hypothetical protein
VAKPAKKKATKKKATKKKVAKKKVAKKAATKKKVKKKASKKSVAKKVATKKAASKPAKKKTAAKKPAAKKVGKKKRTRKAKAAEIEAPRVEPQPAVPEEPGLPLKEVRARLGLIGPQIASLTWLEGLYLYGSALLETPRLEHVDFIVVHKGIRSAGRLKTAESELRDLLAAVLPLDFDLKLTGTLQIGRLLGEGNPAAQALLGYSEPVFARSA